MIKQMSDSDEAEMTEKNQTYPLGWPGQKSWL